MKATTKEKNIKGLTTEKIEGWLEIKSLPEQTRRIMISELRDRKLKQLGL